MNAKAPQLEDTPHQSLKRKKKHARKRTTYPPCNIPARTRRPIRPWTARWRAPVAPRWGRSGGCPWRPWPGPGCGRPSAAPATPSGTRSAWCGSPTRWWAGPRGTRTKRGRRGRSPGSPGTTAPGPPAGGGRTDQRSPRFKLQSLEVKWGRVSSSARIIFSQLCFCCLMSSGSLNRKSQSSVKGAFEAFFFLSFPSPRKESVFGKVENKSSLHVFASFKCSAWNQDRNLSWFSREIQVQVTQFQIRYVWKTITATRREKNLQEGNFYF